jgi:hypothetical protein
MKNALAYRVRIASILLVILYYCPLAKSQTPTSKNPTVNSDSLVIEQFEKQVADYMKLHKKAQAGIPALKSTDSATVINQHRRLLAANIRAARSQAKQGDIFSPQIASEFERLIAIGYEGTSAARVRSSLRDAEPVNNVRVEVNAAYPENIPLQSTPPSILLNLPQLPPELDYRIVGHDLVLRDVGANTIVDYLPNAIPPKSTGVSKQ